MLCSLKIVAQQIKGHVMSLEKNGDMASLPGANVVLIGTTTGTSTDANGKFQLAVERFPATIITSYVGYTADTLIIGNEQQVMIHLKPPVALKQAEVVGKTDALGLSTMRPLNIETITQKELLKAACCNLSESFETNPSININYSDAVTGAKEIQMLGLSGIYMQTLAENIPTMRGLGQTFGLNYVPGPWMESIQITKGAGSVVNGYESLTGAINIEFKKPEETPKGYLNLYGASTGNTEFNGIYNQKLNDKWSTMFLLHSDYAQVKIDHNDDGFLDAPLVKQINAYSRWRYHSGNKLEAQIGLKALTEQRDGGQKNFNINTDKGTTNAYGTQIKTNRIELYTKTGLVFPEKPYMSVGWQNDFTYHDVKSFFGLKDYNANQLSYYSNLIYQSIIKTTEHKYRVGASFLLDNYDEQYNEPQNTYSRNILYAVPGVFAEYTYEYLEKFALVAGIRADYHNEFGMFYTPRLNMKYNFTENLIVRASAGNSFRTANIIADNIGFMSSSKVLIVKDALQPERAWNEGANITWKFKITNRNASLSTDFYNTDFTNQIVADPFSDPNYIQFYNLNGKSYAQSFQVAFNYELIKQLNVRIAYKFDNVHVTYYNLGTTEKPLVSRNKGLVNLSYETTNKKWRADFTAQFDGQKKLASTHAHDGVEANPDKRSPAYVILNAQVTKVFRKFELYAGGENLTNFTQHDPIISAENPFDKTFDATDIWGPIMGIKVYAGFRMDIK